MRDDLATTPESATTPSLSILGSRNTREFIRYVLASLVALAVDTGLLWILTSLFDVPYLYSGAIGFIAGVTVIYILSVRWVFEHRYIRSPRVEFMLFVLIGCVGLLINEAVLWALTSGAGFFYLVSKIASVVLVFTWNFIARKYLLFR